MTIPDWVTKLNPNTVLIAFIGMTVMGVDVLPAIFGSGSAAEKELAEYKKKEEHSQLKKEIFADLSSELTEALAPLTESFKQLNKEMQRGSRWSLEMEVAKWEADGKVGADPREIHKEEMAAQRLRNISRLEGADEFDD